MAQIHQTPHYLFANASSSIGGSGEPRSSTVPVTSLFSNSTITGGFQLDPLKLTNRASYYVQPPISNSSMDLSHFHNSCVSNNLVNHNNNNVLDAPKCAPPVAPPHSDLTCNGLLKNQNIINPSSRPTANHHNADVQYSNQCIRDGDNVDCDSYEDDDFTASGNIPTSDDGGNIDNSADDNGSGTSPSSLSSPVIIGGNYLDGSSRGASVATPGGSNAADDCGVSYYPDNAESPASASSKGGKKTKGRVKIEMRFITNKLRRYTTFSKRKTGIMKKAFELSTLTGTQVLLLVASETGHVYYFATKKLQPLITSEAGKAHVQTCLNSPDFVDCSPQAATEVCLSPGELGTALHQSSSTATNGRCAESRGVKRKARDKKPVATLAKRRTPDSTATSPSCSMQTDEGTSIVSGSLPSSEQQLVDVSLPTWQKVGALGEMDRNHDSGGNADQQLSYHEDSTFPGTVAGALDAAYQDAARLELIGNQNRPIAGSDAAPLNLNSMNMRHLSLQTLIALKSMTPGDGCGFSSSYNGPVFSISGAMPLVSCLGSPAQIHQIQPSPYQYLYSNAISNLLLNPGLSTGSSSTPATLPQPFPTPFMYTAAQRGLAYNAATSGNNSGHANNSGVGESRAVTAERGVSTFSTCGLSAGSTPTHHLQQASDLILQQFRSPLTSFTLHKVENYKSGDLECSRQLSS